MATTSTDAVIYTRVSHAKRQVSIADQERECRQQCERSGWSVRAVYTDDGISASRYGKARPQWEAAKDALRPGDVLVVWEASRATRDLGEYVELRNTCAEHGVLFSYGGELLDFRKGSDRFSGGLKILLAEQESEQLRERVRRGKRSAAMSGEPSGPPPWGFRRKMVDGQPVPKVWEHDPVEAPRVREAARRLIAGETIASVMRWLKESPGWTPSPGTTLQRVIANPTLAGFRVHCGKIVPDVRGTWKPLLTEEQHYEIVALLARSRSLRGKNGGQGPEPLYLLSGIAICGGCGSYLKSKNVARGPAYACREGNHICRMQDGMDRKVEKKLFEILSEIDPGEDLDDGEAEEALAELVDLEAQLKEFVKQAVAGEISAASFAAIEKGLNDRIEALRPRAVPKKVGGQLSVGEMREAWPHLDIRQKRETIRALLKITAIPGSSRGKHDGDLLIERI